MASPLFSFEPPVKDTVVDGRGLISRPWETFLRFLKQVVTPLGTEKMFLLVNNQAAPADVVGLSFNSESISQGIIEYLIQIVTTGGGAVELIRSGAIHAVYRPTTNVWALFAVGTPGPDATNITFSITAAGQVQYTSANTTGTASISKLTYRVRTLAAKNSQYSAVGR